jgi:hypothetical protein
MDASTSKLWSTLDYMQSMLPTNKANVVSGGRLWIGEYGWGTLGNTVQEQNSRAYLQRLLNWNPGLRFMLFWEIYNNEPNRAFWLINTNNVKVASYYLHERFLNNARLRAAQFKERNGRLPTDSEFGPLVSPMLNQLLTRPVHLTVGNLEATLNTATTASISGTLAQGVYGDDCASIRVFYGPVDGATNRGSWERDQLIGLNTNFNPMTFTAVVTNLVQGTNYFYRFYATNSSGESWAPKSDRFSTTALIPQDYGSHMKIDFTGYDRGEPLLDFPVLVNLGTNLPGFSYRQFASPAGGDLRFTHAEDLTTLPFEIDEWNTNGTSSIWVRVPSLDGTNDSIQAYWGNPLAATLPSSSTDGSVWSYDHVLVYHLKESGFPYADSTLRYPVLSGVAPVTTSGLVGRGCRFDGATQNLNSGVINSGNGFTLSAWVNLDPSSTDIRTILANKAGGYNTAGFALYVDTYQTSDRKLILETGDGVNGAIASTDIGAVSAGQWHLITAVVDRAGGKARFCVDGKDLTQIGNIRTDFATQNAANWGRFTNGSFYWKGKLDELRIESVMRSTNWAWASWMTVVSNSALASYSSVFQQPLELSVVETGKEGLLYWPAYGVGVTLQSATNLAPPIAWIPVTNQPVLVSTQWQITLPTDSSEARFYQLRTQWPL